MFTGELSSEGNPRKILQEIVMASYLPKSQGAKRKKRAAFPKVFLEQHCSPVAVGNVLKTDGLEV